ncbi:MAG TPA: SPASM domain-containing protein [Phycisphaerae bacterium]|nr:SPASM domain-containing protein [Phycisphaerae bacterium]
MTADLEPTSPKTIAVLCCDFEHAAIGTRSRLCDQIAGRPLWMHVLERLLAVGGLNEIVVAAPESQLSLTAPFKIDDRIQIIPLAARSPQISARIRTARAWNLQSWRGGAGQCTFFDEEYHPQALSFAAKQFNADHVLHIHSHSVFLDVEMTTALIHHHLHKNHEMRITYTPTAPGLSGLVLRADIVHEMAEKAAMPWQLLAYDPKAPTFDTLIRDACMQVDPALSKIPNRFCADTDRSFAFAQSWHGRPAHDGQNDHSSAALALAAARTIAPGVRDFSQTHPTPRELETELTGKRLTTPPGAVPQLIRESRGELSPSHWTRWLTSQRFPDDLLLTFAGDGDPLLYPALLDVLRAARQAHPLSICLQTDLTTDNLQPLLTAIDENLIDILSITTYGHTAATYNRLSNTTLHAQLMKNLATLAPITTARGGLPLVIPRLLKVRDTIPELEPFFDTWLQQTTWAVIDYPTDRAGQIPFTGVIDMAPPKRRPCRRLWDRLVIRANGVAVACDQDMNDQLKLGNIESHTLEQLWSGPPMSALRQSHADSNWSAVSPCTNCKEWHRA